MQSRETIGELGRQPGAAELVAARLARVVGLGVLLTLGGLCVGLALAIWQRDWAPIPTGLAVGLGAGGLAMLALSVRDVLDGLELATGRDLDGNGAIGPVLLRARNAPDPEAELRRAFSDFMRGCASDTSARRWEGPIGRARYQTFRDRLVAAGYARWKGTDERGGWELTASVDDILAALG